MSKHKDKKTCKNVVCEDCDSEYKITFEPSGVRADASPTFCAFCGSEFEEDESIDDHDEDDFSEDDDEG